MRLATFNLENLDKPLAGRAAVLRPALERLEADVLCLQEVNGQHVAGQPNRKLLALDALLEGSEYATFHRAWTTAAERADPADVHNLVTLSRHPIIQQAQILHDLLPPIETARNRRDAPDRANQDPVRPAPAAHRPQRRRCSIHGRQCPFALAARNGNSGPETFPVRLEVGEFLGGGLCPFGYQAHGADTRIAIAVGRDLQAGATTIRAG